MQAEVNELKTRDIMTGHSCGCGSGGCGSHKNTPDPQNVGTDIPEMFMLLEKGDRVVDFGSGNGDDCIIASKVVGHAGKVIGIDQSEANINRARASADTMNLNNLEFRLGNIEAAPLADEWADVIYASCVFNLQVNKQKVADEMYRVCRHNGYVCISDFIHVNDIPEGLRQEIKLETASIGAAVHVEEFMNYFRKTGFANGGIVGMSKVRFDTELLKKHLSDEMVRSFNDPEAEDGIYSVVLVVEKPESCTAETCCHNPDKHKN
jgi:SAM-dependent methyltransferase